MTADTYKPNAKTLARIEDIDYLLSLGVHPAEIEQRVGLKIDSMVRLYQRAGRPNATLSAERDYQRRQARKVA